MQIPRSNLSAYRRRLGCGYAWHLDRRGIRCFTFSCPSDRFASVEQAAIAAVRTPWTTGHDGDKCIRVEGHHFWVKPVKVQAMSNGNRSANGQLSHIISLRPDDQYYFDFQVKPDGKIVEYKDKYEHKGFTYVLVGSLSAVNALSPAIKTLTAVPVDALTSSQVRALLTEWGQAAGRKIDGTWEGAAKTVGLKVAAVVAADVQQAAKQTSPVVDKSGTNAKVNCLFGGSQYSPGSIICSGGMPLACSGGGSWARQSGRC